MLMKFYHLRRILNVAVGHLRYMYQAIIVDAYIHEGTKLGDIGYDAWHHHAHLQVGYLLDAGVKLKLLHLARSEERR